MSEDKMRERETKWVQVDKDMFEHENVFTYHEEAYMEGVSTCAAIKDAEIAARDLMIKERDVLLKDFLDNYEFGSKVDARIVKVLANSEHHNSRALEKMLLEAEIKGLRNQQPVSCNARLIDCCNKLAELNKE